jgi:site-specific DNA-adenine methylase
MKTIGGRLAAPFPYFGGKSGACEQVWQSLGDVDNYVEPFCGSAAMLLGAPDGNRVETINDADGFVANFWRAVSLDAQAVAEYADWPVNETDLFARHSWLVRNAEILLSRLHADPDYYDPKMAGWWCWGSCNWIGRDWCSGKGPWIHDGIGLVVSRQLPHLGDAGRGIKLPRAEFIREWFALLQERLRDVRVSCGDWQRVVKDSVTTRHGLTGVFLDPPYAKGDQQYAAGGTGTDLSMQVQAWCAENGGNPMLRIILCGHVGEHDDLLSKGWHLRTWTAGRGYAQNHEAVQRSKDETLWCSPHCVPVEVLQEDLF